MAAKVLTNKYLQIFKSHLKHFKNYPKQVIQQQLQFRLKKFGEYLGIVLLILPANEGSGREQTPSAHAHWRHSTDAILIVGIFTSRSRNWH